MGTDAQMQAALENGRDPSSHIPLPPPSLPPTAY